MPATVESSVPIDLDAPLQSLLDFCTDNAIFISPSICPKRIPGRGVGVYSVQPIRPGQKLIHVPTNALLTIRSVPDTFLDREARKQFSVHGLLALYLAFGDDQKLRRLDRWRATWPGLDEFVTGMPVFWGNEIETKLDKKSGPGTGAEKRERKRRKISEARNGNIESKSTTSSPSLETLLPPSTRHLTRTIATKITTIINKAREHFPDLDLSFSPTPTPDLLTLLHTWSLTNTRCFYYVPPGTRAPKDANEAMALVPFMDLFNHTASTEIDSLCTVTFSKQGYTVYAPTSHSIPSATELHLNYGAHDNDALWTEYGFMLATPADDDKVSLDASILPSLSKSLQSLLRERGYWADYSIRSNTNDGEICWRTEVVAWLLTLSRSADSSSSSSSSSSSQSVSDDAVEKWSAIVDGHYIPAEDTRDGTDGATMDLLARHKACIREWIVTLNGQATHAIGVLSSDASFRHAFKGGVVSVHSTPDVDEQRIAQRIDMCLMRWKQIAQTTDAALKTLHCVYG